MFQYAQMINFYENIRPTLSQIISGIKCDRDRPNMFSTE